MKERQTHAMNFADSERIAKSNAAIPTPFGLITTTKMSSKTETANTHTLRDTSLRPAYMRDTESVINHPTHSQRHSLLLVSLVD